MPIVPLAEQGRFLVGEVNPPGRLALFEEAMAVDRAEPSGGTGVAHGTGRNEVALGLGKSSTH